MSTVQDEADEGLKELDHDPDFNDTQPREQFEERRDASQESNIVEILRSVREDELQEQAAKVETEPLGLNKGLGREDEEIFDSIKEEVLPGQVHERPSSADGSLSTPDDAPSVQNSLLSSPGRLPRHRHSPTPSLRPFDRRFQARLSQSPLQSPRARSPAFLRTHSRQPSILGQVAKENGDADTSDAPWEVVRWTKLKKISGQAFSEVGKRNFGRPTCIVVSTLIALGTSKGVVLVFDYHQNLKVIMGPNTQAVENGSITALAFSADHSSLAAGHTSGAIFTWDITRPAKPFLQVPTTDRTRAQSSDGHVARAAVLHLGFLGTRHTALVSADDKGMAFSHLATRGMGVIARSVRTTRILGRYPDSVTSLTKQKKPSTVLAFSPLPLGNVEHAADDMGLVAMLTPYLLVIVSTIPIAQTQHKATRPKELAAHGTMSAALAWFPALKTASTEGGSEIISNTKLAYSWSDILTIVDVVEVELSEVNARGKPPELQFISRARWKADEAIVGIQWLGRSVLGMLTISQQLIILETTSLDVSDSFDLIKKHIYHVDLFSQQLSQLVENLDEEDTSMHGVVADAFYMSYKVYKGRIFLLGFNDVSMGTLSNWADRLLALMEDGNFIGAIELATSYYNGEGDKATVGLPEEDLSRHSLVQEKLVEMLSASLKYAFGKNQKAGTPRVAPTQLKDLADACFNACLSINDMDFLFEDVYSWYSNEQVQGFFLRVLEEHIADGVIKILPPALLKDLISYFIEQGRDEQLENILCRLDPETMDLDQVTGLCKKHKLYDALFYVWSQALGDYTTILKNLLDLEDVGSIRSELDEDRPERRSLDSASKIFPYMSYTLTGRVYPTGQAMSASKSNIAKAELYHFLFSGTSSNASMANGHTTHTKTSFPHLRSLLDLDTTSFMTTLNEAFEDSFLNGSSSSPKELETAATTTDEQRFGMSLNRQYVISILLEVMEPPAYGPENRIYLNMFIARNIPKFPQFILLPGSTLHRVLIELCNYPDGADAEDCQLSVEYLLSVYQPPDLLSMIPILSKAAFYRVMKSIYTSEKLYPQLLQACFDDERNPDEVFKCIAYCLKPGTRLSKQQSDDIRDVIKQNSIALLNAGLTQAAHVLDEYAPELHASILEVLVNDKHAQFQYLREVLESTRLDATASPVRRSSLDRRFIEQYVRLLCEVDPHHVSEYTERLTTGDLRLEAVLPALESSGVIDAAIKLLAREGQVKESISRLTQHLKMLGSALIGLYEGAGDAPDTANVQEAASDLVDSLFKFARIGIWLCHGLSKSARQAKAAKKAVSRKDSLEIALSLDEMSWLELVDTAVHVVREASETLEPASTPFANGNVTTKGHVQQQEPLDKAKTLNRLRAMVQETFTALLAATSVSSVNEGRSEDLSFLRILRAFLNRVSATSPSLSNLRAALAAIFSAYSYEESLLALANRLLAKDLFVHVSEMTLLRKRGWRPLGQACEGCSRKVWGPGAGAGIWAAWAKSDQKNDRADGNGQSLVIATASDDNHKGKAVRSTKEVEKEEEQSMQSQEPASPTTSVGDIGPLVVFACRHMFHQRCLEAMQASEGRQEVKPTVGLAFTCPLCT